MGSARIEDPGLGLPRITRRGRGRRRPTTPDVRFVVASGVPLLADGLCCWISGGAPTWRLVASCAGADGLAAALSAGSVDVLVVTEDLLDAVSVGAAATGCRVIALTTAVGPVAEADLLCRGADAIVSLEHTREEFVVTLAAALDGRSSVSVDALRLAVHGPLPARPSLTPRQREVLELFAMGYSTPQIASQLTVSVNTVKAHLRQTAERVGVSGQRALAVHALRILAEQDRLSCVSSRAAVRISPVG